MVLSSMDIIIILPIVDEVKKNTKLGIIHQRKTTNAFISQGSQRPAPDRLKDRWVSWVMGAEWQGML